MEKARTEGPAAWVFPADDPRPAEQARFLNLLQVQGVEVHRTEKEIRLPANQPGSKGEAREQGRRRQGGASLTRATLPKKTRSRRKP